MSTPTRPSTVVVDTSRSPYARLRPVPLTAVTLTDAFWAPRRRINRELTLPAQYRYCEETGRVDNFRRAAGDNPGFDLRDVLLPAAIQFSTTFCPGLLGGVVALRGPAQVAPLESAWHDRLYRTGTSAPGDSQRRPAEVTAIPYYAWANREPGQMQVWPRSE